MKTLNEGTSVLDKLLKQNNRDPITLKDEEIFDKYHELVEIERRKRK